MANLKEIEAALVKADAAGNTDDAKALADEYRRISSASRPIAADMPDDMLPNIEATGLEPIVTPQARPEPTLGEQVVGAGETALTLGTGAVGGTLGHLGGAVKGIAQEVVGGEFGTQAAAERIKEEAATGAQALTYAPRTEAGQEQVKSTGEVLSALPPMIPGAAPLAATIPGLSAGLIAKLGKDKMGAVGRGLKSKSLQRKQAKLVGDTAKQGYNEPLMGIIADSTAENKKSMSNMVKILKKGIENPLVGSKVRPTDMVGRSVMDRVRHVENQRVKAGHSLDRIADGLKGQSVDYKPAMNNFMTKLKKSGVEIEVDANGKVSPNFRKADFQGDTTAERIITKMVKRLSDTDVASAYDVHRAKRYISSQISFGKQKSGLSGQAEAMIKELRHDLDSALDGKFKAYKDINTKYGKAREAIDEIQSAIGTSVDLKSATASRSSGTAARRLLGNAQSRDKMMGSIAKMERIMKESGGKVKDDVHLLSLFADELDKVHGATARTSLKGQTEQVIQTARRGLTDVAIDTAGKAVEAARGINEKNAIKSLERLLSQRRSK